MRTRLLALLVFALPVPLFAAPLDTAAVDALVAKTLAATKVPSASIAIVEGGKIVYAKAYGEQGPGTPAVAAARYPIASISKQITATAILMLADQGKLKLSDPIGKYVPGLTGGDTITIAQVLSHTSGLRDYWPQDYPFADMAKPVTPQQILDRWATAPLDFPPGTQWQYSNTGYVVAGQIIEKVSGEPLMTFLTEHIFRPLGMTSVVDADTGMTRADAVPHLRYALGPVRVETPSAPGWLFAAGELAMTASDLARWDIAMIDHKLLSPASYQAQQTPVRLPDGKDTGYGLGVETYTLAGHHVVEHEGEAVGFLSHNLVVLDAHVAIVVLDNADFGNAQGAIAQQVDALVLPDLDRAAAADVKATHDAHPPVGSVAQARTLFDMLRAGQIDRSQFTANGNAYFTPTAVDDYRASLAPLGAPSDFTLRGKDLRGGFTEEVYRVVYPDRKLTIILRAEPGANGRVEQFTVYPVS